MTEVWSDISKSFNIFFLRAGFGETPWHIAQLKEKSLSEIVKSAFADSANFKQIHYLPYPLKENREKKGVSPSQFLAMILKSRKESEELNVQWLFKMTHTRAWLREKMVFFWHNHFSTSVPFSYLMQVQNNTIRKHALGSFRDLLFAIAKDPAMILYLNNQENKKDHPNENFAREVMELFTLGIGNYTEKDVQEAARAFTGWGIDGKGEFVFRKELHDGSDKTFRGRTGNFSGELVSSGQEWQEKKRFIPFFNPQWQWHYNGRSAGLFTGFGIRNIGFTHEYSNDTLSSIKLKQRAYSLNLPVGVKLGNMRKGNFIALGMEGHLPFHFKEKIYEGGKISRNKEWFSDHTASYLYSFFIDLRLRYGSYFRVNIFAGDLLSKGSRVIVLPGSGESLIFEAQKSSLFTFSFGTSLMTKKKRPLRLKDV